jgi:hypothetical protein
MKARVIVINQPLAAASLTIAPQTRYMFTTALRTKMTFNEIERVRI